MAFFALFLFAMFPLGVVGIILTSMGLRIATKNGNEWKRIQGMHNYLIGIVIVFLGLLGTGLLYLVTS